MLRTPDSEMIIETPELLSETIQILRSRNESGLLVGERRQHRGWPPGVYLTFLKAPIIALPKGELQRRLYGTSTR